VAVAAEVAVVEAEPEALAAAALAADSRA